MTEQQDTFQDSEPIIPPTPPTPTEDIENEADRAIGFISRLANNSRLDAELRVALKDVENTIKTLKWTVISQGRDARQSHEKMIEILRANTPNRRRG